MWSRPWIVRLVVLAAALDPLDRPAADRLAGEQHQRHVGVAEDLGAEGAADVGADAADLVLRDAHHERGEQQPLDVRRLARHPDRVLVGAGVVPADVAAGLHRVGDEPLVDEPLADDDLGVRRSRASVPSLSPTVHSNTTLFGAFSWSCGAPGCIAFSASTTAGSGSQSTWIASSASCGLLRASRRRPPRRPRPST